MYLSERIYSTGNYYLDEVLDNAFYDGISVAQRMFAEEEEKKSNHKVALKDINNLKHLKSKFMSPISGTIGAATGKVMADRYDDEGADDNTIRKKSTRAAALTGAGLGAAIGAGTGALTAVGFNKFGKSKLGMKLSKGMPWPKMKPGREALIGAGLTAGLGALAAGMGARKNVNERLKERKEKENE